MEKVKDGSFRRKGGVIAFVEIKIVVIAKGEKCKAYCIVKANKKVGRFKHSKIKEDEI